MGGATVASGAAVRELPVECLRCDRTSHRVRFVDIFTAREHVQLASGSLVPPDWDTSVLTTTAGMQPLKRYFLGIEAAPAPRAVSVQKCFRTTDIDQVGQSSCHLTFFETIGNFSIGDYFKEAAIQLGLGAIYQRRLAIDPSRIWASVYEGRRAGGTDEEAPRSGSPTADVPARAIGPAGRRQLLAGRPDRALWACSELYYDRGPEHGCGRARVRAGLRLRPLPRVLEPGVPAVLPGREGGVWRPLPQPSVDTGCGLERMARADAGRALGLRDRRLCADHRARSRRWSGTRYGSDEAQTQSLRVLADHGRAMTFLAATASSPPTRVAATCCAGSSGGRCCTRALGLDGPFPCVCRGLVVDRLGEAYPELVSSRDEVASDPRRRGGAVRPDAAQRRSAARRRMRTRGAGEPRAGRGRVPPARHLRLPVRADRRDRRRAGQDRRRGRVRAADGGAAPSAPAPAPPLSATAPPSSPTPDSPASSSATSSRTCARRWARSYPGTAASC